MPSSPDLAQKLSISAHPGTPLSSYERGVDDYLTRLTDNNSALWTRAQAGDRAALDFFAKEVEKFDNILTTAFREGAIFTNNGKLSRRRAASVAASQVANALLDQALAAMRNGASYNVAALRAGATVSARRVYANSI